MNLFNYTARGFIFCLLMTCITQAQLSPSDFLLTAFEASNTTQFDEKINFIDRGTYRLPLGEEIEFRYSNAERTLEDARYRLRLRPTNPWKIRRNNALFNALRAELSLEQQLVYNENLYDRYITLLDYIFTLKETELLEQRYLIASKKLNLFQQNPQADLFDARDFVDAKLESIERLEDLEEAQIDVLKQTLEINLVLNSTEINWEDIELITIDQISEISQQMLHLQINSTELEYLQQQIEVARLETAKERADFDIGFVEARLAPNLENDKNELGFAFGVTIPIFSDNKDQIAERVLDEIELTNELLAEESKDSVVKVIEFEFLQDQLVQYQKLSENISEINVDGLAENLAISEGFNPIALLELEEGKLKLQQLLMRSQQRVLEQFIEVLFAYDALQSKPLRNYLQKDLEIIE